MNKLGFTIIVIISIFLADCASLSRPITPERKILEVIRTTIANSTMGQQNHWEALPCGGYIFRFRLNIIGQETPEFFINYSGEAGMWFVFIDDSPKQPITFESSFMNNGGIWLKMEGKSCISLVHYHDRHVEHGPLIGIYKEKITKNGVQLISHRSAYARLEKDNNKYDELYDEIEKIKNAERYGGNYEDFKWIKPKIEYILIYDFLTQEKPQWKAGWPDSWAEKAYAGFDADKARILQLEKKFRPKMALILIEQKLNK